MFVEDLPAWNAHIRSSATLRQMPKHHFADPSLACGVLRLDKAKLFGDLEYFELLFESLVIRDLRIYAQSTGGKVWHYRDSAGTEVDAIVERADGSYIAVEIKLGVGAADVAAETVNGKGAYCRCLPIGGCTINRWYLRRKVTCRTVPCGVRTSSRWVPRTG